MRPSSRPSSRPASRSSPRTPSTSPTLRRPQSHSHLDNDNNPHEADTQPFNTSSDEDYAEVGRRLENATTGEDYKQVGEVNISVTELHSFVGSELSIILHGDPRDYSSIMGEVQHVRNGEICLAPATIEGQKVQETKIAVKDISRCATLPEKWDQSKNGPALYQAENVIKKAVDQWADNNDPKGHKRQPSMHNFDNNTPSTSNKTTLNKGYHQTTIRRGPHGLTLNKGPMNQTLNKGYSQNTLNKGGNENTLNQGQPESTTYRNPFTPLKRPQLTQMSQTNENTVPKLARTTSIYPNLDQSRSFSSMVKGYVAPTEEEERLGSPPPQPKQPFNATERLIKRREHWEQQFNFEFNKEVTDAELESRIANWYSATEKAAYQCKLEIPKLGLYSILFHPELETPMHILAKQIWNHFETYGFNISPTSDTITCVDTPKECIDSELDIYTGTIPHCKPEYRPKI